MVNHPHRSPVRQCDGAYEYRFVRRGVPVEISVEIGRLQVWIGGHSITCQEWFRDWPPGAKTTAREMRNRALEEISDWLKFHADDANFGEDEPGAPADLIALAQKAVA